MTAQQFPPIRAEAPDLTTPLALMAAEAPTLEAADDGDKGLRKFSMVAYTGGPMMVGGWYLPVVLDLASLTIPGQARPILRQHDPDRIVGHSTEIKNDGRRLTLAGVFSGAGPDTDEILALADQGFPWQASVGATPGKVARLDEGETTQVNGRTVTGPAYIARNATLGEVSFVPIGADSRTSARLAAAYPFTPKEPRNMDPEFKAWLEANGHDPDNLTAEQMATLSAQFAAENPPADPPADPPATPPVEGAQPPAVDHIAQRRQLEAAETERVAAIREVCAGRHTTIEAEAIREGWTRDATELAVLRAERNTGGPAIHTTDSGPAPADTITAALCLAAGIPADQVAEDHNEATMNRAVAAEMRGYNHHSLMFDTIRAAGLHARPGAFTDETLRLAFQAAQMLQAAGTSTVDMAGSLGAVANKTMLAAFTGVQLVGPRICGATDVTNFNQYTRYRMLASGEFEQVGASGELNHASLGEETYTGQIDTFGRILTLDRQALINDGGLGQFLQIPKALGRMAALALDRAVFTKILGAVTSGFFAAAKGNYATGATTALSHEALTTAVQKMMDQTDRESTTDSTKNNPVYIDPALLLVPTALKGTADELYKSAVINQTPASNKKAGSSNIHHGLYEPVVGRFLSQGLSSSSSTGWYLFADPADAAAFEIAYLTGKRTPTIEKGQLTNENLGVSFRGYWDFGVAEADSRAVVHMKGA